MAAKKSGERKLASATRTKEYFDGVNNGSMVPGLTFERGYVYESSDEDTALAERLGHTDPTLVPADDAKNPAPEPTEGEAAVVEVSAVPATNRRS